MSQAIGIFYFLHILFHFFWGQFPVLVWNVILPSLTMGGVDWIESLFFHIKSLLFLHTSASCHPLTIEQFSLLPILTMENMATVGSQVHVLFVLPPRIDRVNSWPQSQIWKNVKFRTSQLFHESCSYCTEMLPLLKSQGCVCLWSGSSSLQKGKWFPKSAVSTYLMGPNCNVYFKKASRLPLKRFTCHPLLIKNIVDGEWDWAISNHHLGF